MLRARSLAALSVTFAALGPSAAAAPAAHAAGELRAEPLADVPPAPGAGAVADRVIGTPRPGTPPARAAQASGRVYATRDGQSVRVQLSSRYAADERVGRSYVDFLDSLLHGRELGRLTVRVVPPDEVPGQCGAPDSPDILACYTPRDELMVVPGEQPASAGVSTSYIVAHEYGHHIAANRSNAPFSALDYGPKRWSSEQDVCTRTLAGELAPGNEGELYRQNPGEAWAETFAQLKYPRSGWDFAEALRPTASAFAAATADVLRPWTRSRVRAFRGRLSARRRTGRHRFRLTLDGALRVQLTGPARSNFDLAVRSSTRSQGTTRARGSRDTLSFRAACVRAPETVTVTVRRRAGAGRYRLAVAYAG